MRGQQTLRSVALENGIAIGAAVGAGQLRTDHHYRRLVDEEFTAITTENALKMAPLRPEPGVYDFADADAIVNFGNAHGMTVRGHTLVWHNQQPDWFLEWDHSDRQIRSFLREHIHTVAGRYRETIDVWDVVNEAITDDGSMRKTVWYEAMDEEYLDLAFQWAHDVAPDAALFYNDYNAEGLNDKSNGVYELLTRLLDRGVPVDGVGLQMHALRDKPDLGSVAENVERLQELGLTVHLTEVDVAYPESDEPADHDEAQAAFYGNLVELCHETGIDTMVTWGVRDTDSWIPQWFPELTEAPLLFDGGNSPKPAYHAVKDALASES